MALLTKSRAERQTREAWRDYLEACRAARLTSGVDPVTVEQWAWRRLQDQLNHINNAR